MVMNLLKWMYNPVSEALLLNMQCELYISHSKQLATEPAYKIFFKTLLVLHLSGEH